MAGVSHGTGDELDPSMGKPRTKTRALALPARLPAATEAPSDGCVVEVIDNDPTWPYERTDVFVGRTPTTWIPGR
jgi:hypothetical protein